MSQWLEQVIDTAQRDDYLPMVDGMAPLPGTQISITLPAVVGP